MYLKQRHLQLIGSMKVLIGSIHQPALTSSTPSILIYQGRCGGSDVLEPVRASAPVHAMISPWIFVAMESPQPFGITKFEAYYD